MLFNATRSLRSRFCFYESARGRLPRVCEKYCQVMFDVGFVKLAAFTMMGMSLPVREALVVHFQAQMFAGGLHAEVLYVRTSESAATNEAVAGSARPADFD